LAGRWTEETAVIAKGGEIMLDAVLTEEQKKLRDEMRVFVRDDVPRQLILDMDAERVTYPRQFLEAAARRRLLGLRFPEEYGGRGLGWADEVLALSEVGVLGGSLPCLYSLVSIVGEALHVFGTPEQKDRWLRPALEGKLTVAEALTEPRGGSDFFGATTTARRDGDVYVLNGQKRFIVGAEGADYFLVYARTNPDASSREALSAFIVEKGPDVEVQHVYGLLGTRGGGAGRVYFRDVCVPRENLIGQEHGGAELFYQMMIPERMTSAAGSLGGARSALEIAARYSNQRKAFGQKIRAFEGVSFKVADSITLLDASRALVDLAARCIDAGDEAGRARRLVSEAKKFATESAWEIINHAMQIMGGIGYTNVYPIERLLRDSRLSMIWTGTSEIMNLIIQHEYYRELGLPSDGRDVEADAPEADQIEEKVYE
jgi:alkylation response protein AidB-like acyl-CoA dehydrogenase